MAEYRGVPNKRPRLTRMTRYRLVACCGGCKSSEMIHVRNSGWTCSTCYAAGKGIAAA